MLTLRSLTAVALAAALDAAYCEIYSDVDGIFTADPRIVPGARQIPEIGYEDMLEMAANGAKILHLRCVEYARREHVAVHVRSSFSDLPGTWVRDINYEESGMEQPLIEGSGPGLRRIDQNRPKWRNCSYAIDANHVRAVENVR